MILFLYLRRKKRRLRSMLVKRVHATYAQGQMSVTSAMQAVRVAVTQAGDSGPDTRRLTQVFRRPM
ncbi:hypothetical protein BC2230_30701 [Burkholderia cepacia]